jgi:HlyD family secretion protein
MFRVLLAGSVAAGLSCAAVLAAKAFDRPTDVVVAGSVIVDAGVTPVQHPTGGIIAEVRRRNGDQVKSGELLARLDDTAIRSELLHSSGSLDLLVARKARLEAELDGTSEIKFPPMLADRRTDVVVLDAMNHERRLFTARSTARQSETELQRYRIKLLEDEINGLKVQEQAKASEASLIQRELEGIRHLRDQNLAPIARLTSLERDAVRLDGDQRGAIPMSIAQARSRIADTQLQIIRADRDGLRDIANELRDTDERLSDLMRRRTDFEEQLRRAQIIAPLDGIVLSSAINAAGCPVIAGRDIMLIAPVNERPTVEARLDLASAARLRIGQTAKLAVASGADSEFAGRLERISPVSRESAQTPGYATLRFALEPDARATLATLPPGTSVNISISTGGDGGVLGKFVPAVTGSLARIERTLL